jgi:NitT/TauT family transport system ATP-binding protein
MIDVDQIVKTYPMEDGSKLTVLEDLSFEVQDREFFTFVGPSGCGKSTLMDIIAGLTEPDTGAVNLQNGSSGDRRIGFVFQSPTLLDWKTVEDNLTFALKNMGVPESKHEKRIQETLEMVGLAEFRDEYPQSLSGGMQQRVGLARAFCVDPDILLLDEPFGSLDELTARQLRKDLLEMWREQEKTVIFVTHDINEAAYMSDRVGVLSKKPTSIDAIVDVDIDRPRKPSNPKILEYEEEILGELGIE